MNRNHQRALLLLLLYAGNSAGIKGITRLQKILYILKKDYNIDKVLESSYDFEPYRFGPYSKQLYDDIDFLENLGLIRGKATGDFPLASQDEEEQLLTDYLLTSGEEDITSGDRLYTLTERGHIKVKDIMNKLSHGRTDVKKLMGFLVEVKERYAEMDLSNLIHYVYRKYPDSAVNSELKHLL